MEQIQKLREKAETYRNEATRLRREAHRLVAQAEELEQAIEDMEVEAMVPGAEWVHFESFFPYYSSMSEAEFDRFLKQHEFSELTGGWEESASKRLRLRYVSGNHERDSSGDHYVVYRRREPSSN